jgi:zinc D-Ala-D-Ala carboxypeptidase
MKISKHISLEEATISTTAVKLKIDNTPSKLILEKMQLVAEKCFEPLREWYGKPIRVNSFYRCDALNKAVGGSATSQHAKGEAIDLSAGSKTENKKLFDWLKENVEFCQLIHEYGDKTGPDWVHISYSEGKNKKQILYIK